MNRGVLYWPKGPDQVAPIAVIGEASNLLIQSDATAPNTKLGITADEIVLKSSGGRQLLATAVNVSADITQYGPGGLDAGAEAASTWYYVWLVGNGTDLAALLSASATEINLMFGWEYRALLGAVYNDAGSNFIRFWQAGRRVARMQVAIAAPAGPAAFSIATAVPPNARTVFGNARSSGGNLFGSFSGDSNGVGQLDVLVTSGPPALRAYFELPLITAQTLYNLSASGGPTLDIAGFTL